MQGGYLVRAVVGQLRGHGEVDGGGELEGVGEVEHKVEQQRPLHVVVHHRKVNLLHGGGGGDLAALHLLSTRGHTLTITITKSS
eukprot:674352-Prorocentrum_minimum.AAC.2